MIYLYEYSNRIHWGTDEEVNHFLSFLEEIWNKRQYSPFAWRQNLSSFNLKEDQVTSFNNISRQQFVSIDRQNYLQAKNYVGIIRFQSQTIHLLPKIFYSKPYRDATQETINFVHQQLMRWLTYSSKITFPLIEGHYNSRNKNDLAEIILFTFAQYTHQLLQKQQFTTYETVQKNAAYVKGRMKTAKYVTKHLGTGKWQQIPSEFDEYGLDNTFNRILKCTVTQLLQITQNATTQSRLQQILQSLSTVSQQNYQAADCNRLALHPLFEEWQLVLNYCRLFLASSANFSSSKATKALGFLIPMEQLFEQF
ncbi:MAG: 5-methylcytosine restriction system specificity protein McrC, partial [Chitinophagales bacterium]